MEARGARPLRRYGVDRTSDVPSARSGGMSEGLSKALPVS